jgi:hypothetical protein
VIALAIMPFAVLAAIGLAFDVRVLGFALVFLAPIALALACHAFVAVRFRHMKSSAVLFQIDIPARLVLTRAVLPLTTLALLFAFLILSDSAGGGSKSRALAVSVGLAFVCWAIMNWLWRRWARSLGFEPDAVLASMHRSRAYRELEEAARRRDAAPPAA